MSSQFVSFTVEGGLYGVEVAHVQEALRRQPMTPVPRAPAGIAGLVNLRGQVVTAIDLRHCLGLTPLTPDAEPMLVVVRVAGEPLGLLVDEIGDVIEVRPDQFEPPPDTLPAELRQVIVGAYALDGALLLALDIAQVAA